jgi:Fe-S oxidoreductase
MATYKAEVLHQRYRRRLRPSAHYSLGWLPRWARMAARAPKLANATLRNGALAAVAKRLGGIDRRRPLPEFAAQSFRAWFAGHPAHDGPPVLLWVDTFTDHFTPEVGRAAVRVLEAAGYSVQITGQPVCCGLTWISTGQLNGARRQLRRSLDALDGALRSGTPIVGLEPSCTAVLRGEVAELLPGDPRAPKVRAATRTLAELLAATPDWAPPDLTGVRAVAQPHCHHHAVMGWDTDAALLAGAGAEVKAVGGCCGLAGNFGVERGHYDVSRAVAETALLPAVRDAPDGAVVLADGFSCRTQLDHLSQLRPGTGIHLAQLLAGRLDGRLDNRGGDRRLSGLSGRDGLLDEHRVPGQDGQPVVQALAVGLVRPVPEQALGVAERLAPLDLVDLQGERHAVQRARVGRGGHDRGQPGRAVQGVQGLAPLVGEGDRQPHQEREVVGQPADQGMPVVQVEMQGLAQAADRAGHVLHVAPGAAHRVLDVRYQAGQAGVGRAEAAQGDIGMAAGEPGGGLPDPDVAHVDAGADPLGVLQLFGQLDEPPGFQAGRVFEEHPGRVRDAAEAGVQVPQGAHRIVGRVAHAGLVVDDHAGQAPGQAVGELLDQAAVPLVQQVQPAIQVNRRAARVRRHVREQPVKVVRRVGVQLGGQAGLGETEAGQPGQRVVPGVARLEESVNDTTGARLVHATPSPARRSVSGKPL